MNSKGFTLIEVLIAIAIVSILSGVFVLNIPKTDKTFKFEQRVREIAQELKGVREWALSLKSFNGNEVSGYGIRFDKSSGGNKIIIYVDSDGNNAYQPSDDTVKEINLNSDNIYISEIKVDDITENEADIFFKSPQPTIYIDGAQLDKEIEVFLTQDSHKFKIYLNRAGLIYVKRE